MKVNCYIQVVHLYIYEQTMNKAVHYLVASRNIARVQCSTSSESEGGGGRVRCSTKFHSSETFSPAFLSMLLKSLAMQ